MDRLLVWNVRGVNSPLKHRDIKTLITQTRAGFVSLLETKIRNKDMGKFYKSVFLGWCFTTNIGWHKGGRIIMLAWNPIYFIVDIQNALVKWSTIWYNKGMEVGALLHVYIDLMQRKIEMNYGRT